jgi:hypothetical protein
MTATAESAGPSWFATSSIIALDLIEAIDAGDSDRAFAMLGRYSDPRQLRALAFSAAALAANLGAEQLAELRELYEDA